ncbi:ornithine cyclodeaminase family protein [Priestia sp. JNUCC 25]
MSTLLLNRTDVKQLLDVPKVLDLLEDAFRLYSSHKSIPSQRSSSSLPLEHASSMVVFPGLLPEIPAYTVKVHAKYPNKNPSIKGVIHLHDIYTGKLLSMMDSTYITAVRTGLAGAVGTHTLAKKSAKKIAIIGCGVQGEMQLKSIQYLRRIEKVWVFDKDYEKANMFSKKMQNEIKVPIKISVSVQDAVRDADIIISATWSREPFIFLNMIKPGTHITTLGADELGKCEVSREVVKASIFISDDKKLVAKSGAIQSLDLSENDIQAELGEVLMNPLLGRRNDEQITIFGAVGLAFQDLVSAWYVYQKAKQNNIGLIYNFMG